MFLFAYYLLVVIDCLLFSYLLISVLSILHELVNYANEDYDHCILVEV